MYSLLLKKALPFALTFILGSLIGGLFNFFFGMGGYTPAPARTYFYGYGDGQRHSCRMRARTRYLVAETKPLAITFKPDAHWPRKLRGMEKEVPSSVFVHVTFGADGKVQVQPPTELLINSSENWPEVMMWDAAAEAARNIKFEPEMVDSVPVSVERDVEIHFMAE